MKEEDTPTHQQEEDMENMAEPEPQQSMQDPCMEQGSPEPLPQDVSMAQEEQNAEEESVLSVRLCIFCTLHSILTTTLQYVEPYEMALDQDRATSPPVSQSSEEPIIWPEDIFEIPPSPNAHPLETVRPHQHAYRTKC